jgi:hypothetical protein
MPRRRRDRRDSQEIWAEALLVCEGADDCYFFDALRSLLGIPEEAIQIETFAPESDESGKSRMPEYLNVLEARGGFGRLRTLGIVVDADTGADATLGSLKSHLLTNRFDGDFAHAKVVAAPHPLNLQLAVGVFITPDGASEGALEDLFIAAIREVSVHSADDAIACVDSFAACVDSEGEMSRGRREKMRLYAWLSTRERPAVRPGQALHWEYLDFECSAFAPACQFLLDLVAVAPAPGTTRE